MGAGRPHGYAHLLEIVADSDRDEHDDMTKWYRGMVGDDHNPDVFPIERVNAELAGGIDALVAKYENAEDEGWDDEPDEGEGEDDDVIRFPER